MRSGKRLIKLLRQSDYVGELEGGKMYALLANTSAKDATMVRERFEKRVCPARYRRMYLYDGCGKEICIVLLINTAVAVLYVIGNRGSGRKKKIQIF